MRQKLYSYVANSPILNIDPMGLFCGNACDDLNHNGIPDDDPMEDVVLSDGTICDVTGSCFPPDKINREPEACYLDDAISVGGAAAAVGAVAFPEIAVPLGIMSLGADAYGVANAYNQGDVFEMILQGSPSVASSVGGQSRIGGKVGAALSIINAARGIGAE